MGERDAALHGVLVTYRRPADLTTTLDRLATQSRRLDTLVVVDNDADPRVEEVVAASAAAGTTTYLATPENLGPAGALAIGVAEVLRSAGDDWVVFLDDDDPPRTSDMLAEITEFAEKMLWHDPAMAGVGLVGARFDARTGRTVRIRDEQLIGSVEVDYIGGGQLPCYRADVMREVGAPEPSLFFGFDDLEYGSRLTAAGRRLYIDGAVCLRERRVKGLVGVNRRPSRELGAVGWRDYYTTRNLVWILRNCGHHRTVLRVVAHRVVGKGLYNVRRNPLAARSHIALGLRATFDAYRGRMGRTVEPASASAAP